jgi:hypothetical protein
MNATRAMEFTRVPPHRLASSEIIVPANRCDPCSTLYKKSGASDEATENREIESYVCEPVLLAK